MRIDSPRSASLNAAAERTALLSWKHRGTGSRATRLARPPQHRLACTTSCRSQLEANDKLLRGTRTALISTRRGCLRADHADALHGLAHAITAPSRLRRCLAADVAKSRRRRDDVAGVRLHVRQRAGGATTSIGDSRAKLLQCPVPCACLMWWCCSLVFPFLCIRACMVTCTTPVLIRENVHVHRSMFRARTTASPLTLFSTMVGSCHVAGCHQGVAI